MLPGALVVGVAGLGALVAGLGRGSGAPLLAGAAVFGIAHGAAQNLTWRSPSPARGAKATSTVSAVWNAAFDTGTGIGAVAVGALAATGMGVRRRWARAPDWSRRACRSR